MSKQNESVRTLIVGAGISGLCTAAHLGHDDYCVLEADAEIGGFCKTIHRDGFVWDYSGHFFHFKHPDIEAWLRQRMPGQNIRTVQKKSFILYKGQWLDFPFQKNIHQLPQDEFIECLHDVFFARAPALGLVPAEAQSVREESFKDMLYARLGKSIAEKFLIPYNEKLYACDLSTLDKDAMGRFFPQADLVDIVRNMKGGVDQSYNATFTYPQGGAFEYVKAIASEVKAERIFTGERLLSVDLEAKVATTTRRKIGYDTLVSSMPFPKLVAATGLAHDPSVFSWNKVLVFNLGFDAKGPREVHWLYVPDRSVGFYRVGFYDNIFDTERMSLYVEVGLKASEDVSIEAHRQRVLTDLKRVGIVTEQRLVAEHSVVMDPAYVHITRGSMAEHQRLSTKLKSHQVHSIGRYGGWTYCSIEDNMVEARALALSLAG